MHRAGSTQLLTWNEVQALCFIFHTLACVYSFPLHPSSWALPSALHAQVSQLFTSLFADVTPSLGLPHILHVSGFFCFFFYFKISLFIWLKKKQHKQIKQQTRVVSSLRSTCDSKIKAGKYLGSDRFCVFILLNIFACNSIYFIYKDWLCFSTTFTEFLKA